MGFIGLSKSEETFRFIQWWKERLWHYCLHDIQSGLFVDQKWLDMVPSFFDEVFILKEPGYNVSYWNLHEKKFSIRNNRLMVNGMPLKFFHFSGLDIDKMESISKYQTRYRLNDFRKLRGLFELYKELLIKNGYHEAKAWPYSYNYFDNGEKIRDIDRRKYWIMEDKVAAFGNPFETKGRQSFYGYLRRHRWKSTIPQKIISIIISIGLKYKANVAKMPFISRIAKKFYHKFLVKERTIYNSRGTDDHDSIDHTNIFLASGIAKGDYGINLAGYLDTESGVGESARSLIKVIQSANMPFVLNNVKQPWIRRDDKTYISSFTERNPYFINLLHVNADQAPVVARTLGRNYFSSKYNIAYWYWETSKFPYEELKESFDYFNEVWVASNFCLEAISEISHIPVVKIPPAVNVNISGNYTKDYFGINPNLYTFFYMFDFLSYIERKNPFAAIDAFKLSYHNFDMRNAVLVIKCSNNDKKPKQYNQLLKSVKGLPVLIINGYLSKDQLHGLINISDCYVSLHRAEGLSLPIAEAMYLGKPVIVTAYSGNMDFTNNRNSFLVDFNLTEIEKNIGPYKKGYVWAEPDIGHAASFMFKVYQDREESVKVGQEAARYIRRYYSPSTLAARLVKRVELIKKMMI
jgi:glycosyltransferase involved in cell wall biosynthesis